MTRCHALNMRITNKRQPPLHPYTSHTALSFSVMREFYDKRNCQRAESSLSHLSESLSYRRVTHWWRGHPLWHVQSPSHMPQTLVQVTIFDDASDWVDTIIISSTQWLDEDVTFAKRWKMITEMLCYVMFNTLIYASRVCRELFAYLWDVFHIVMCLWHLCMTESRIHVLSGYAKATTPNDSDLKNSLPLSLFQDVPQYSLYFANVVSSYTLSEVALICSPKKQFSHI